MKWKSVVDLSITFWWLLIMIVGAGYGGNQSEVHKKVNNTTKFTLMIVTEIFLYYTLSFKLTAFP